jgi:hypothetical protein
MTFVDKVEALRQEIIYPKALAQFISVQCDEHSIRVKTSARLGLDWNQRFSWSTIVGACCVFGSNGKANILFLDLRDRSEPGRVLLDSPGAEDFFSQLLDHGIFPIAVREERPQVAQIGLRSPASDVPGDALKVVPLARLAARYPRPAGLRVQVFQGAAARRAGV